MNPVVSIIIPAFERVEPLKATLKSAYAALEAIPGEIILVDDGSDVPLEETLTGFKIPFIYERQANHGSIVARQTGLQSARGTYVLFLDSDDLIAPDKLKFQVAAMEKTAADVSYSDCARESADDAEIILKSELPAVSTPEELFLKVQPPPHSPVYRREYLQEALSTLLVPANRLYDASGDVWLYYNLVAHPAKIVKQDRAFAIISAHDEDRYSNRWEELGIASLGIAKAFVENCPKTPETLAAREMLAEITFHGWRALPYDIDPRYDRMVRKLMKKLPKVPIERLGGSKFQFLAKVIGKKNAAKLIRRLTRPSYASVKTVDADHLDTLIVNIQKI